MSEHTAHQERVYQVLNQHVMNGSISKYVANDIYFNTHDYKSFEGRLLMHGNNYDVQFEIVQIALNQYGYEY